MQTTSEASTDRKPPAGRKAKDGTDEVIRTKPIKDACKDMMTLYMKKQQANADFNAAVKAVAERSNTNASNIKKLIAASASGNFADIRRGVDQQAILFEEVGEIQVQGANEKAPAQ